MGRSNRSQIGRDNLPASDAQCTHRKLSAVAYVLFAVAGIPVFALLGCAGENAAPASAVDVGTSENADPMADVPMDDDNIVPGPRFEYVEESNATFGRISESLEFTDSDGETVSLNDLARGRAVVLVITRGPITADPAGSICPVCSTQTARFVANYEKFRSRNTEVVVVYPQAGVSDEAFQLFIEDVGSRLKSDAKAPPFPVVFDYDHEAVADLGLVADPVKPSTFVFDADHSLMLAYVGETALARPSIQSLLDLIDSWSNISSSDDS